MLVAGSSQQLRALWPLLLTQNKGPMNTDSLWPPTPSHRKRTASLHKELLLSSKQRVKRSDQPLSPLRLSLQVAIARLPDTAADTSCTAINATAFYLPSNMRGASQLAKPNGLSSQTSCSVSEKASGCGPVAQRCGHCYTRRKKLRGIHPVQREA